MGSKEIADFVHHGLSNGYKQNLLLLSSYENFAKDIREYLLTVNVAQSLLGWNRNHDFQIRIEYPILHFYNNAFVESIDQSPDIFTTKIAQRRTDHSPTNALHQKIDIAIVRLENAYIGDQERTVIGIELKGPNIKTNDILDDIRRMARAMGLTDRISDNSIKFCFSGFIIEFDNSKIIDEVVAAKNVQETYVRWESLCRELNAEFPALEFSFNHSVIESIPLEMIEELHRELDSDYAEVASKTGLVISGLVEIKRRN